MTDAPANPGRPRIVFLSASLGSGHHSVTRSVIDGLEQAGLDADIDFMDTLDFASRWFRFTYSTGFELGMTRLPKLYGLGFWLTNRPKKPERSLREMRRLFSEGLHLRKLGRFLQRRQPDLVVCTHFVALPHVVRYRKAGLIDCPIACTVTDIEVHRWWYAPDVDRWWAPQPYSADTIANWGVPRERITVSGIAIHPKWLEPRDPVQIRREWGFPEDKPVVLLSGGSAFTCGPVVKMARHILDACPDASLLVLAGKDQKLLDALARLGKHSDRLFTAGWTQKMADLVSVASLMVTKAGGITTSECIATGTPMVIFKPVPGQEAGNAKFLQREGAAVICPRPGKVGRAVADLLARPDELAKISGRARELYRPATQTIASEILGLLGRTSS
jgi:processive 1,2-diacylglycerol beta-glucosyltransferase